MRPEPLTKRPSHLGLVVADLDAAMAGLGASWVAMEPVAVPVAWPGREARAARLRIAWASLGRLHCELIEAVDVDPWMRTGRLHHVGWWVPDVEGASKRLAELGLPLEACDESPSGRPIHFAYHRAREGRVEVSAGRRGEQLRRLCPRPAADLVEGVDLDGALPSLFAQLRALAGSLRTAA